MTTARSSTAVSVTAWAVRGALVLAALALAALVAAEGFLQGRDAWQHARLRKAAPRRAHIEDGCRDAGQSYVHPLYLFFFPLDPARRDAIASDVCNLTPEGFREPGLQARGQRRLAFLIGGSVAFSDMASSDAATITSALNGLQQEYFFVTAGVSGWNSTQELSRVALQLLDYHPALIVTLDGANDAGLAEHFAHRGGDWVGAPANFDLLEAAAERRSLVGSLASARDALFPMLAVRHHMQAERAELAANTGRRDTGMREAARRYVSNLTRMRDMVEGDGGRFVAVFQPMAALHTKLEGPVERTPLLSVFHDAAVAGVPPGLEFHDFARLFDGLLPVVRVNDGELTADTVFVDEVHLYDPGNAMVARALWKVLEGRGATSPAPQPAQRP